MFEIGNIYYGFILKKVSHINEYNSDVLEFNHVSSGAELVYVTNNDEHKVFNAVFKTLPNDSKGVPHIVEHSVLCGSRKYKVKEPFIELEKGTLHTYLNAITYADKTVYPIATLDDHEFMTLMDVYLDAIFFADMSEETFMQEGWNSYCIDGKVKHSGVVYNEMKGALSSPEAVIAKAIQSHIYSGSGYAHNSGGEPQQILKLTYSEFLDFYKERYHPSNCMLYLYGNGDVEKHLQYIDKNYLCYFAKRSVANENITLKAVASYNEAQYTLLPNVPLNEKNYFAVSFTTDNSSDIKMRMHILDFILMDNQTSPLKKALTEKGIGERVYSVYNETLIKPVYSIVAANANAELFELFKQTVADVIASIVRNGIDEQLYKSAIEKHLFFHKEQSFGYRPKGLVYGLDIAQAFVQGFEVSSSFNKISALNSIKSKAYIMKLLNVQLNENNAVYTVLKPTHENLEISSSQPLTDEYEKKAKRLKARQSSKDSEEALNQIPLIDIKSISTIPNLIEHEQFEMSPHIVLHRKGNFNGITYFDFAFSISHLSDEQIQYASLIAHLLGKSATKNYSSTQLAKKINLYFGKLSFIPRVFAKDKPHPCILVKAKFLDENIDACFDLLKEIILYTNFEDDIDKIIAEHKSRIESSYIINSYQYAISRCQAHYSNGGAYRELVSGIQFGRLLGNVDKSKIATLMPMIFSNSVVAVTSSHSKSYLTEMLSKLCLYADAPIKKEHSVFKTSFNEAFAISSSVYANVLGFKIGTDDFSGSLFVLKSILENEYLWNSVRIKGGAYGTGFNISISGDACFYSMRDPHVKNTYEAFKQSENFIRSFYCSEREMTKHIIGTINRMDRPLSNSEKNELMIIRYITNTTNEQLCTEREQILSTKAADISKMTDFICEAIKTANICTIGSAEKLSECFSSFEAL